MRRAAYIRLSGASLDYEATAAAARHGVRHDHVEPRVEERECLRGEARLPGEAVAEEQQRDGAFARRLAAVRANKARAIEECKDQIAACREPLEVRPLLPYWEERHTRCDAELAAAEIEQELAAGDKQGEDEASASLKKQSRRDR